jgi:hypothetical protein
MLVCVRLVNLKFSRFISVMITRLSISLKKSCQMETRNQSVELEYFEQTSVRFRTINRTGDDSCLITYEETAT